MASRNDEKRGTRDSGWRLLYDRALAFMAKGQHQGAADVLRLLALASPGELEVWEALATCHDAEDRPDIGDALRSLAGLLQIQLQEQTRSP
jgi:hypothetical protein